MMQALVHLVEIFFTRHWMVAMTNAFLTAVLGLGVLSWAKRWKHLSLTPIAFLRLRRFVLLCALYKGALYLLLGVSFRGHATDPVIFGAQLPDPLQLLGLFPETVHSIWFPTAATKQVSLLILGFALVFLVLRCVLLVRAKRGIELLLKMGGNAPSEHTETVLQRAAITLGGLENQRLPSLIIEELGYPTPMLLGLQHPYLVISPSLVQILTDAELEMAFRHELVHFYHRDHWWRWSISWLEDVGRLNILSSRLGLLALDLEEELCDRLSVETPQDALNLARAIRKSFDLYQRQPEQKGLVLPSNVLPRLLGRHTRKWSRPTSVNLRIERLLALAQELSSARKHLLGIARLNRPLFTSVPSPTFPVEFQGPIWVCLLLRFICGFLLFIVIYAKFYIAIVIP